MAARFSLRLVRLLLVFPLCFGCAGPPGPDAGRRHGRLGGDDVQGIIDASVLQHHKNANRDGLYVDESVLKAQVPGTYLETDFGVPLSGPVYAQPLYLNGGPDGLDMIFVATETNTVYGIDAYGSSVVWQQQLGTPVPRSALPCGDIDPLGITGTPVIDYGSRTLYLDAMTTPDGGATKRHLISDDTLYAFSVPGRP